MTELGSRSLARSSCDSWLRFIALAGVLATTAALGAQDFCDPALPKLPGNPQGYRMRADRCEGIYAQELGASVLQIASLTALFEEIDPDSGRPLELQWERPACGGEVHIRAQGLKRRLYYRMDTQRSGGAHSYSWPGAMLAAQGIGRDDIGVLAWTRCPAMETDVYLPVTVRQSRGGPAATALQLVLIPGVELAEIYLTLSLADPRGIQVKSLQKEKALGYGYYPAERKVEIPIGGLKTPGLYHLQIAARTRNGSSSTNALWFQYGKD